MRQDLWLLERFLRDESGVSAVEFAIVSTVFFMLLMGLIEYGLMMLTKVAIESALMEASRSASVGSVPPGCSAGDRVCAVQKYFNDRTSALINPQSVKITSDVVTSPTQSTPPTPDICLDNPSVPYPATCVTWMDNNPAPGYQPVGTMNVGNAGDVVEIRVTYLWRVIFPMFRSYFGTNGVLTISSSTVVKNEPYE